MTDIELDLGPAYRRIRWPLILLAATLIAMLAMNWVIRDIVTTSQAELTEQRAEANRLERQLSELQASARAFDANLPSYRRIDATGFLDAPDLTEAERTLRLSADTNLINQAFFEIRPTQSFSLGERGGLRRSLRVVPIQLRMDALFDDHIFGYVGSIQDGLPGIVAIRSLSVSRQSPSTRPVVDALLNPDSGSRASMFRAELMLDWVTLELEETDDALPR